MPVLHFKGKTAVENYHYTVPHRTLEFDKKLSVLDKGQKPGLDGNLIIEGDNLLALKALLPTHAGRVKCIYIDPPYNTGNESWVYNDNLTQPQFKEWIGQTVGKEGEDACRHDKWCCMMYPRLALLKELLRDDGLIWASIDENEVDNLHSLMDEVFGRENRLATVIWQKADSPSSNVKKIKFNVFHEYLLVYSKSPDKCKIPWQPTPGILDAYPRLDQKGRRYRLRLLRKNGKAARREDRPSMWYKIEDPDGNPVYPIAPEGWEGRWSIGQKEYKKRLAAKEIVWTKRAKHWVPYTIEPAPLRPETPYPTLWTDVGQSRQAKAALTKIMGRNVDFDTPKPVTLISRILEVTTRPGDIVLDSFAGSGTTGHAVLELGQGAEARSFVLIQQPHEKKEHEESGKNISQEITAERIRRVIGGYRFRGEQRTLVLDETVGLQQFKKPRELWKKVTAARERAKAGGKRTNVRLRRGQLQVWEVATGEETVSGLGGSFTYARLGPPLFSENRTWGKRLPAYDDLARYVFYTETSHDFDPKALDRKSGKIGEHEGTAYFLLYTPEDGDSRALDEAWLKKFGAAEKCKRLVVYCEKIWLHRDDLLKWQKDNRRTVRPMQVPFNLK